MNESSVHQLALENHQLREALLFAEKGWRDLLMMTKSRESKSTLELSARESVLEIKSLQHEVDMLQRQILKRKQDLEEFEQGLLYTASELEETVDRLMVLLKAEVPAVVHTTLFAKEIEALCTTTSSSSLSRLRRVSKRLQSINEWASENTERAFTHYDSIIKGGGGGDLSVGDDATSVASTLPSRIGSASVKSGKSSIAKGGATKGKSAVSKGGSGSSNGAASQKGATGASKAKKKSASTPKK